MKTLTIALMALLLFACETKRQYKKPFIVIDIKDCGECQYIYSFTYIDSLGDTYKVFDEGMRGKIKFGDTLK